MSCLQSSVTQFILSYYANEDDLIDSVVVTNRKITLFLLPSFPTAKTEHKSEIEMPMSTKVKVTDFFQRLVCGLLIFFHNIVSLAMLFLIYSNLCIRALEYVPF